MCFVKGVKSDLIYTATGKTYLLVPLDQGVDELVPCLDVDELAAYQAGLQLVAEALLDLVDIQMVAADQSAQAGTQTAVDHHQLQKALDLHNGALR